jgi:hypothetical protein
LLEPVALFPYVAELQPQGAAVAAAAAVVCACLAVPVAGLCL